MAYIDVDTDNFSTSELIRELENRYLDNREKNNLLEIIKEDDEYSLECRKLMLFLKVYERYSMLELEEMFKEDLSTFASKNQLKLAL